MKKRVRRILNFFAFNFLFFSLYLNFIHQDKTTSLTQVGQQNAFIPTGVFTVENPTNNTGKNIVVSNQVVGHQILH